MSLSERFITIILIVLALGMGMLGFFQFTAMNNLSALNDRVSNLAPSSVISADKQKDVEELDEISATSEVVLDDTDRLSVLEASVSSLVEKVEALEKNTGTTTIQTIKPTFQKETIFLGSTTGTNRNWGNSGLEVIIDSSDYPSTVSVSLEAGLSIIGGEASARILNKTTGAILSNTEITSGTSEVIWRTSGSFKPYHGKNTYVLQTRSSSGEVANITGARLVIK